MSDRNSDGSGTAQRGLVPARIAAALLGVKPETVYAYVSRGLLTSHRRVGERGSWFDPAELDDLARRGRGRGTGRRPDVVVESAVTLVADGAYWYRGHDPVALCASASFEQVAELLWTGVLPAEHEPWTPDGRAVGIERSLTDALPDGAPPMAHLRAAVPLLAAHDPLRSDLRAEAVVEVGRHLLATLVALLPRRAGSPPLGAALARRLWPVLTRRPPSDDELAALEATMILLADHELAASTSAVRIAASFRADPYAAVSAGLATLSGAYHGGASALAERLLAEVEAAGDAGPVVGEWLARGERIPGLGQHLYPDGDPRGAVLLERAGRLAPDSPAVAAARAVAAIAADRRLPRPNVDFAVATLGRALDWIPRAGEVVFAVSRIAGWLAHALEEYASRSDLRLRALYTGTRPPTP